MSETHLDPLRAALRQVVDPCSIATGVPIDLLDMGLVKDLRLEGGIARVELMVTSPLCTQIGLITGQIMEVLTGVDGVDAVEVTVDARAEWWPDMMAASARERLRAVRPLPVVPVPGAST
jgi:metal-sulfur cluster biosynthetic enzyme